MYKQKYDIEYHVQRLLSFHVKPAKQSNIISAKTFNDSNFNNFELHKTLNIKGQSFQVQYFFLISYS